MKYCIDYTRTSRKLDLVDEITIPFNKDNMLTLINFLEEHKNQRSIIFIEDINECIDYKIVEKMIELHKEHPDYSFALKFNNFNDKILIELLDEAHIDYFFNDFIGTWDVLYKYLTLGVSDVYIVEELGFEIDKVAEIVHKYGARVRVFPNVAQSSWDKMDDLKKFFIRPEDVEYYENYVDVMEIFAEHKKHDLYYEIYAQDKKWFGELKYLIIGFNEDLDSKHIIPRFAETRTHCRRKCIKGGKCNICEKIKELSKNLEKVNIVIKKKEETDGKRIDS